MVLGGPGRAPQAGGFVEGGQHEPQGDSSAVVVPHQYIPPYGWLLAPYADTHYTPPDFRGFVRNATTTTAPGDGLDGAPPGAGGNIVAGRLV